MLGHCKCSSSLLRKGIKKKVTPGSTKWGTAETAIHGGEYIFRKAVVETKLDQLRCDVGSTYHGLERSFFLAIYKKAPPLDLNLLSLFPLHSFLLHSFMYNLLSLAAFALGSLAVSSSAAPTGGGNGSTVVAVNSDTDFCLFLPPQPGLEVATHEDDGVSFCLNPSTVPGSRQMPDGKTSMNI